ncbi:MAG: thioredoxin domain-containing protein [Actinobacteria bacterium]|nr:thioredoxin domain-containing protein [Actinomycetota bacterium]
MGRNRLAGETSPYLRQHAGNPVDWWPWCDEAFEEARRRDVPVLLSVGYSACHWCHVMAHESFEDSETAEEMNRQFVNIKVDREERPDVDAVYMEATQAMTGSGGWPMTVFMTPEGEPFFCGTYFPNRRAHGRPAFVDILHAVDQAWHEQRSALAEQAARLVEHLRRPALSGVHAQSPSRPGLAEVDAAVAALLNSHDDRRGGFGRAPKFPQASAIDALLRAHVRTGDRAPLAAARTSLDHMAAGGIHDHLGGGFARYSVDDRWLVPHFEKMLYDQALLARAYLHGWQVTGDERYRQVLDGIVGYVLRDLRHAGGGFFSAEDADSEGEEGRFYLWTPAEIESVLGRTDAAAAMAWWDVTPVGNFEGRTILNRLHEPSAPLTSPAIDDLRSRLFAAREGRVRPGLDDKVLTEWNALMLATLSEAAAATGNADWLAAARANGEFLLGALRRPDGRWLRAWQADGGARHLAFAADHAALVDAFTRLAEATGEARWMAVARDAADALLERFTDPGAGGFFTTASDGERLVARQKDVLDGATPSANSLAAASLVRLAALTGEDRYAAAAGSVLDLVGAVVADHPTAFAHLLLAVELDAAGTTEIAVVGDAPDLLAAARSAWRPTAVVAWGEPYPSPLWEGREPGYAYVCRNFACRRPVNTAAELIAELET